jgi:hypothetical protein
VLKEIGEVTLPLQLNVEAFKDHRSQYYLHKLKLGLASLYKLKHINLVWFTLLCVYIQTPIINRLTQHLFIEATLSYMFRLC